MTLKIDRKLAAVGLLLTVFIFIGHYFLPEKTLALHPRDGSVPQLYSFTDMETGPSAKYVNEETNEWLCNFKSTHDFGCGWEVYFDPLFAKGIDVAAYDAVVINMHYEGPASRIRLYMRNFNKAYAEPGDGPSTKFLSMTFQVSEAKAPVVVDLSEFSVATWWLQEQNIRRQWSLPEFDNVIKIGVDFIEQGEHKARVDSITLRGRWIRTETLLLVILGFWMTVFIVEGMLRFYLLFKKSQHERHMIKVLEHKQQSLEEEKKSLRELADTDPLTGVYNRTGMESHIKRVFGNDGAKADLALMLMDIDHFKQLNDTHGHDMGDKVLKAFAAGIAANLRATDMFARWGGEEFIIISESKSVNTLYNFAEKLREITEKQTFGADSEVSITVSIGITMAYKGDAFDEAFKRADKALYKAKESGRNRVEYEQ